MDTLAINFYVNKKRMTSKGLESLPNFNSAPMRGQQQRRASYMTPETAKSPLPYAGSFLVKAIPASSETDEYVAGYKMSINIPACTVGNNWMLVNDMYSACRIALRLLKHWLLDQGCHRDAVRGFDLDHAEITAATPTFLVPFSSNSAANAAKYELFNHADALHNLRIRARKIQDDPVQWQGSPQNGSWYLGRRGQNQIRVYVKNGRTTKSHAKFASTNIEEKVFAEGGRYLRVEVDLSHLWFKSNGLQEPKAWSKKALSRPGSGSGTGSGSGNRRDPYAMALRLVRKKLRFNTKFRQRTPRAQDLPRVGSVDRDLVDWHLNGNAVREHQRVLQSVDPSKYFSEVRLRVLKTMGIDYGLPWRVQLNQVSRNLKSLLNVKRHFKPPQQLQHHVFGPKTIPAIIEQLDRLIETLKRKPMQQRLQTALALTAKYKSRSISSSRYYSDPDRDLGEDSEETSDISDVIG